MNVTMRNNIVRQWVGLDALTLIVEDRKESVQVYYDLRDIWDALRQDGNRIAPFRVHKYNGHGCGPLRIGTDGNSTIIQCTGALSGVVGTIMAQYSPRATRVDIQATWQFAQPDTSVAVRLYDYWEQQKKDGLHRRANKLVQSSTGATVYTGSRKGDRTFRVYDKSVELEAEKGTYWRTEVEYHSGLAQGVWSAWKHTTNDVEWLEGAVYRAFALTGLDLEGLRTDLGSEMEAPKNLRSIERYLKWFGTSVAPVVRDLRGKVEDGIILEALGLQGSLLTADDERSNENGSG